jgi:AcrR family transcriptional regulator
METTKKHAIYEAALELFAENRVAATTTRQIVDAALRLVASGE